MIARALSAAVLAGLAGGAAAAQDTPRLDHVFTITAELGATQQLGQTGRGERRIIPITGGQVEGARLSGTVRPGAWDWQLVRPDGCTDLVADYFIDAEDGAVINVRNTATVCGPGEGEAPLPIYTRPQFEPPVGAHEWLGRGTFVGKLEPALDAAIPAVRIAIYQVR